MQLSTCLAHPDVSLATCVLWLPMYVSKGASNTKVVLGPSASQVCKEPSIFQQWRALGGASEILHDRSSGSLICADFYSWLEQAIAMSRGS